MTKKILLPLIIVIVLFVSAYYFYAVSQPEYIASKPELAYKFFDLPKEDFDYCYDELLCEGANFFDDYGFTTYWIYLKKDHPAITKALSDNPNTIYTDSTLVLIKRIGGIEGKISVDINSNKAVVHYRQIYEN